MKKHTFLLFFLYGLGISLFSCTSTLQVRTIMPAKVKVTNDQWKVMAINRFNPSWIPFEEEEKIDIYEDGAQEAFLGAVDAILEDSTYFLAYIDSLYHIAEEPAVPLSAEEVKEIHQRYPFHLLLSLENFDVSLEQESILVDNGFGPVATLPYYKLVTTSSWVLYDSLGNMLDQVSLSLDELYKSGSVVSDLLGISPSLDKIGQEVKELAWYTGYEYWKRLSPKPVSYKRPYFTRGKLEAAAYRMSLQDWEGAIALLKPIAEGEKKEAGKAAFNLAVAYEALGNFEQANYWATMALHKNVTLAYILLEELGQY